MISLVGGEALTFLLGGGPEDGLGGWPDDDNDGVDI